MIATSQTDLEELFQSLFTKASEGMLLASGQGEIVQVNEAFCQQSGYSWKALQKLTLDQIFPENLPSPEVRFAVCDLRQQNGNFVSVDSETRLLGNGRFLLILHPYTQQAAAKQKIAELAEMIQTINDLAIKLSSLLSAPDPLKQIAIVAQGIPGVFAVTVATYEPEFSKLVVRELTLPPSESGVLKKVEAIIGRSLIGIQVPVHAELHERILTKQVTTVGDLHAVSLGKIPKPVSKIFHDTFMLDKLYGLALADGDELLGAMIIAMRRNAEPLTQELRIMLGRISAITLRRSRYEQRLQASEAKFRSYIEHAPLGIFVVDRNGRYLEINPAAQQMLGYTEQEFRNLFIKEIIHPDFLEAGLAHFQQVLQTGYACGEFCLCTKNGDTLWVIIEAAKLDEQFAIAFVQDISLRKKAEENIKLKDELLQLTTEMGHIGGWEFSADTLEGTWTEEVAYIHDLLSAQNASVNFSLSFYSGEHRQKFEQAIHDLITEGIPYDLELLMTSAKGVKKWIRTMAIAIWEDGKIIKARGIFQDITKTKQAEAALRQQIELQHQLVQIAATVPGMICTYKLASDGHATMPFTSAALEDLFGIPPQKVAEDAAVIFESMHADDRKRIQASILKSAKTLEPWFEEFRINHPQKGERWIEGHSMPQQEDDDSILWHGFVQDITERKTAEQEQAHLEAQLRQVQKMDSIGRLAGGVAHDFNNILTVIQMYADLMDAQMQANDPLRPKLSQIKRASERASDLTRQLLAFSRKQILNTIILDLNDLILHVHKMLGRLIGEDIALKMILAPDLKPIQADPGQIEQVIMNLVINARDAMPTGGQLTIETQNIFLEDSFLTAQLKSPTGPTVMLAISDTGHGMDEATRQRIFEPFFTTKEPGSGTGLGLATVHGIVRQSGGAIFVYSEPNQGTTFKIYLPASNKVVTQIPQAAPTTIDYSGTETILVVEDEEGVRTLVCNTLQELGYTVLAAKDGFAALSVMNKRTDPIDLLLTDVVMPNMSGRELAEQLLERQSNLKVLFMSGYMDDAGVRHGILTAQVAFLPKPFSSNLLESKVREVLDE